MYHGIVYGLQIGPPPRLWGNFDFGTAIAIREGPPPRVWGNIENQQGGDGGSRPAPTPVGKTSLAVSNIGPPPRLWGEPFGNVP